jgi:hypothetical protein
MFSLLRSRLQLPALIEPARAEAVETQFPIMNEATAEEPGKRDRQQNIKVSEDCSAAFAALAKAQGISKAALFEDMVAERLAVAKQQGMKLRIV